MAALVTLHIYDVSMESVVSSVNSYLQPIGTGAFHGAVEVYGWEWSYGYVESGTGVFPCEPRRCRQHRYRESMIMGTTPLSERQVEGLLEVLRQDWRGTDYDLLRHNCCSFCDEFCHRLRVGPIPDWVTNLAGAGATLQDGVLGALVAGQAAAIIAAARAGQIDARYNIRGTARARAKDVVAAIDSVSKHYRIKEAAQDIAVHAAVGAVRACHEVIRAAEDARGAENTPARRVTELLDDPFLNGQDIEAIPAPPTSKGGAAAAASDVNRLIGRMMSRLCLDRGRAGAVTAP